MDAVEVLILGAGWTSQFLFPLLVSSSITFAATTTSGHESYRTPTIPFTFDHSSDDIEPYTKLPLAKTILVTFPLKGKDQSKHIIALYNRAHSNPGPQNWIQLGSTGIFTEPHWNDYESKYDKENVRSIAEDELLEIGGCVLNLAGLYGGERDPKTWVTRVAKTKDEVRGKNALHLIHGEDVARAILAVHVHFTPGKRWLLTDLRVYDWWDLIQDWGAEAQTGARETLGAEAEKLDYTAWVGEIMVESGVRSLPRSPESLGRVLDSRAFWNEMGIWPSQGRVA